MKASKWLILSSSLMGIVIVSFFALPKIFRKIPSTEVMHVKYKLGSYFIPFEIAELNHQRIPCLPITIENQTVPLALDTGSSGQICLYTEILDQLHEKTFLRLRKSYGLRGKEYEKKIYNIPKIQIGNVSFFNPLLDEGSELFRNDAIFFKGKDLPPIEKGRLGWRLFRNTNLFLDLGNSKIAICDSIITLTQNGYDIDKFVKTPLYLDNNMIQIDIKIDQHQIRCCLDTGATWNMLNSQKKGSQTAKNLRWDVPPPIATIAFQINETPFGDLIWRQVPICLPFHLEAMLGMDFFKTHLVFLDFSENYAYISKKPLD